MRIEFGFGVGLDKAGAFITNEVRSHALHEIAVSATNLFGGCTLIAGHGYWKPHKRPIVSEECRTLIVYLTDPLSPSTYEPALDIIVRRIKLLLNQESVVVVKFPCTFDMR